MSAIYQIVAGFGKHDAISNEARVMQGMFREWGYESKIASEAKRILPELRKAAIDLTQLESEIKPEDVAFLHLSIGSPANELFKQLKCKKVLLYHNITPPEFFFGVQEEIAANLALGREQMKALAGVASVNLADSRYNADELEALGYGSVAVLPLILDFDHLRKPINERLLQDLKEGGPTILFVGRMAPNKKIEDALSAFYYFQKYIDSSARFIHVGSAAGTEHYQSVVETHARKLGVENVTFAGAAPQADLNAYYRGADLFLCLSEHEGFCIPLIESMECDLPVLAYAAAAVPETLGGAGVLVREKNYDALAEMMKKMISDSELRHRISEGQRQRLDAYQAHDLSQELKRHFEPVR